MNIGPHGVQAGDDAILFGFNVIFKSFGAGREVKSMKVPERSFSLRFRRDWKEDSDEDGRGNWKMDVFHARGRSRSKPASIGCRPAERGLICGRITI